MKRICSTCGNPAVDDISVFCNKCGARLPVQDVLICQDCGKRFSDGKSRFCNICGTPLSAYEPTVSPLQTARAKTCPACGMVSTDETQFYCKKCGRYLLAPQSETKTQKSRSKGTEIRIIDDSPKITLLKNASRPEKEQAPPPRQRAPILHQNRPGLNRKTAAVISGIIFMIIIMVLVVYIPGILQTGSENATADTPSVITTIPQAYTTPMPIINQGVRVTTEPRLNIPSYTTPMPIINQGARV
jgi:predicted amidophosphoribosyltransferase